MSAPISESLLRTYTFENKDLAITDENAVNNLEVLTKHKEGQKYRVREKNKLCVDDRYVQWFRRSVFSDSEDSASATTRAILVTLDYVEKTTKHIDKLKAMPIDEQTSHQVVNLADITKRGWFLVQKAIASTKQIGHDYIHLDSDKEAGERIEKISEEYKKALLDNDLKIFFVEDPSEATQFFNHYFAQEILGKLPDQSEPVFVPTSTYFHQANPYPKNLSKSLPDHYNLNDDSTDDIHNEENESELSRSLPDCDPTINHSIIEDEVKNGHPCERKKTPPISIPLRKSNSIPIHSNIEERGESSTALPIEIKSDDALIGSSSPDKNMKKSLSQLVLDVLGNTKESPVMAIQYPGRFSAYSTGSTALGFKNHRYTKGEYWQH